MTTPADLKSYRIAGKSMAMFAGTEFFGSLVASVVIGTLKVDLFPIVLYALSVDVSRGNARATRWSVAATAMYLLTVPLLVIGAILRPERLRIGSRAAEPSDFIWVFAVAAAVTLWSTVNVVLLLRALQSESTPPESLTVQARPDVTNPRSET